MEGKIPAGWRLYFTLLGAVAVVCIAAAVLWFLLNREPERQPAYLLKDNGGRVALYAADGAGPLAEYDIYTRLLPEEDVLALQGGVTVWDADELQHRLEDYGF